METVKYKVMHNSSVLKPHDGYTGEWTLFANTSCKKDFIVGAAIEIFEGGITVDDRGATNLKMFCNDTTKLEANNNDKRYVIRKGAN